MPRASKNKKMSKIDEEIEESFPASDPPAFVSTIIGAPPRRSKAAKKKPARKMTKKKAVKRKAAPKRSAKQKPAKKKPRR